MGHESTLGLSLKYKSIQYSFYYDVIDHRPLIWLKVKREKVKIENSLNNKIHNNELTAEQSCVVSFLSSFSLYLHVNPQIGVCLSAPYQMENLIRSKWGKYGIQIWMKNIGEHCMRNMPQPKNHLHENMFVDFCIIFY